jgi:hypothetical protein
LRGRKIARLIPYKTGITEKNEVQDEIFGLWRDKTKAQSVEEHVRSLRKGRTF